MSLLFEMVMAARSAAWPLARRETGNKVPKLFGM